MAEMAERDDGDRAIAELILRGSFALAADLIKMDIDVLRQDSRVATSGLVVDAGSAIDLEMLESIARDDTEADAVYDLGVALWAGDGTELLAMDAFRVAADAGSTSAASALGEALNWFGNDQAALRWLEKAANDGAGNPWILGLLGESRLRLGDSEGALPLLERAARDHPTFGVPLARLLAQKGQVAEAIEVLTPLSDTEYGAAVLLGNALKSQGRPDEAIRAYEAGVRSGDAHSAYNLGLLYSELGARTRAEDAFRVARDMGDLWTPPPPPLEDA